MTSVWISVVVVGLLAAAAGALAVAAHIRLNDQAEDLHSLVHELNAAGAGLSHTGVGYSSHLNAPAPFPHPLAADPGEIPADVLSAPTMRAMSRAQHALRQPTAASKSPPNTRDWLRHYSTRPGVTWDSVTAEFYEEASKDREIKAYFVNTDMGRLKKHFSATLEIVTRDGVNQGLLQSMRHAHHGISDRDGHHMRVTGAVFDRTIKVLAGVLRRNGVPEDAIDGLAETVAPLRDAIVDTE